MTACAAVLPDLARAAIHPATDRSSQSEYHGSISSSSDRHQQVCAITSPLESLNVIGQPRRISCPSEPRIPCPWGAGGGVRGADLRGTRRSCRAVRRPQPISVWLTARAATGIVGGTRASPGAQWIEDRQRELLDVRNFHEVFTSPTSAVIAFEIRTVVYDILFLATWETLRTITADPAHLGAEIGFLTVLHPLGQEADASPASSWPHEWWRHRTGRRKLGCPCRVGFLPAGQGVVAIVPGLASALHYSASRSGRRWAI